MSAFLTSIEVGEADTSGLGVRMEQFDHQQQAVTFYEVFGFDAALLRDDVIPRASGAARS